MRGLFGSLEWSDVVAVLGRRYPVEFARDPEGAPERVALRLTLREAYDVKTEALRERCDAQARQDVFWIGDVRDETKAEARRVSMTMRRRQGVRGRACRRTREHRPAAAKTTPKAGGCSAGRGSPDADAGDPEPERGCRTAGKGARR